MTEPIDLNNAQQSLPPIDLNNVESPPALSPSVVSSRASKAEFGLSQQTGQKYQDIHDQLSSGKETEFRTAAAASVDNNKLKQFSNGQIPAQELLQKTNPDTVIENNYAAEWVKRMYNVDDPWNNSTHIYNAQQDIPGPIRLTAKKASNIVAIGQQLNSAAEEMEALYKKQGYGTFIGQQLEGLVPFFTQHEMRGFVPHEWKWLPGNDIDEQSQALFRMDPWDAALAINKIKTDLKFNPGLASYFLRQLQSQSDSDRVMQNELGLIDMAAVAGLGMKVAGLARTFNGVTEATRDVVSDGSKMWTGNREPLDPDIATWEGEGGAVGREPVETANARAKGDLETAALHKVTEDLQRELEGKPKGMQRSVEALLSEHRIDVDAIKNDARIGPDERELANRLADSIHRRDLNVLHAFSNMMRPDREPLVEEKTDVLRAAEQKIKDDYKGVDNQILDVNTHYDPITNTRYHVIEIGQADGKLFPERPVAEENARINGFVLESSGLRWDKRAKLYKQIAEAQDRLERGPSPEEKALEAEGGPTVSEDKLRQNIEDWKTQLEKSGPEEGFRVQRKGNGFYIEYTKPRTEWVRALTKDGKDAGYMIPANEAFQTNLPRQPSGLWNWFTRPAEQRLYAKGETPYLRDDDQGMLNWMRQVMGWARTGDETFARETREQLKIATHVTNVLKDLAASMANEVKIPKRYWPDFIRVLKGGQHWPDPDTGIPGYTFRTIPELNNAYQTFIHRLPTSQEVEGYFAWSNANDLDLLARRINLYIPKAIRGAEQFQFSMQGLEGRLKSGFFEAVEKDGIPGGEDNILVMGGPKGQPKLFKANDARFLRFRKSNADKVASGQAKVLEVVNPDIFPLRSLGKIGDERIRYIMIEGALERKPLSLLGQLPRRGGGHLVPDADHYIKQANVHVDRIGSGIRHIYLGDNTVMPMYSRSSSVDITNKLNKIRQMIDPVQGRFPNIRAARDEFNNLKLPFDWNEFYGWFKPSRNPATGEMVPARLSTREPFHAIRKDETVHGQKDNGGLYDRYPHTFVDGTRSGSLARTISVEFSGERDAHQLMTVMNKGSEKNPIYSYQPTNLVDPIAAQYRGLSKIINSTIMNDVKIHSMNKWLRDAQPYLNAKPNEIWHSPYTYFEDGDKATAFRKETPWAVKQTLLANHMKIKAFLGVPSKLDNIIHSWAQQASDSIHGGDTAPKLIARQFLASAKDPIPFVRSLTYSADMGLGSVKQYFTQATTFSNVLGMSPRAAGSATLGSLLHQYAYFNHTPEILDHLDNIATKLHSHLPLEQLTGANAFIRYKPGYWKEARQLAIDSGFTTVAEEHALSRDAPLSTKVVQSAGATILDWGRMPFTLGATQVRINAIHTAYLEFRERSPTGALSRKDKAEILDRATTLDHNMSRASNSILHTGWMSIPGQFFAYDLRLAEIMTGKRISPADKARLFATSSVLYGIPIGGLGLYGYPLAPYIYKLATEEYGYVAGASDKITDFMMNGAPSAIMQSLTGRSYAFSKFGSKGVDYLEEFLISDKEWWKIAGGAVGSMFENAFKNSSNLMKSVLPEFMGGVPGMKFKAQYALDAMKFIASYNEADKLATAFQTGKIYSSNGRVLADDITVPNAIFQAVTGVPETRYSQKYIIDTILRDQNQRERNVISAALDNWGRYINAMNRHDQAEADDYKNNTFAILNAGGFPTHRLSEAIAALNKGYESTIRETNERYFKEAPEGKEQQIFEQFQRLQNRDLGNQ